MYLHAVAVVRLCAAGQREAYGSGYATLGEDELGADALLSLGTAGDGFEAVAVLPICRRDVRSDLPRGLAVDSMTCADDVGSQGAPVVPGAWRRETGRQRVH